MRMPYKYGTRRVIAGKFKFLIVYLTRQDEIVVIAMAPFKRKQGYWHSPPVGLRSSRRTLSVGRSRLAADLELSLPSDRRARNPPLLINMRFGPLHHRHRPVEPIIHPTLRSDGSLYGSIGARRHVAILVVQIPTLRGRRSSSPST